MFAYNSYIYILRPDNWKLKIFKSKRKRDRTILKMINFQSPIFRPVKRASTSDLASELNHDNHIYDEDVINVAPNDSNWGARPIRSLQKEQSKSFLDDLTFSLDEQRVVCCRSPLRRRYDTNFDYNRLLERVHERAEERDKKRSVLVVVTNTSRLSGSCERGRNTLLLLLLPLVRYWGREGVKASRQSGEGVAARCISWIKKVIYLAVSRRAGAVGV